MCVDIVCVFVCVSARWAQLSWTNTWRNVIPDRNPHLWVTPPLITLLMFWQIVTHSVCACLQVYYVENINSGPADRDETLDQVPLPLLVIVGVCVCFNSCLCIRWVWGNWTARSWRLCWTTWMLQPQVSPVHLIHMDGTPGASGADFLFVVVGLQCDVEECILSHSVLQDELNNPKNGDSAHKHLKQQVTQKKTSWVLSENLHRHNKNTPAARAGKVWTAAGVPRLHSLRRWLSSLTCQVCSVVYLRSPGSTGATGTGSVLCGIWSRSRETFSLDPRSPEDTRAPGDPGGPAATAGGAQQHTLQGRNPQPIIKQCHHPLQYDIITEGGVGCFLILFE